MKTILVPTDFSDNAMHAAQYAATLARVLQANIIFLNIYTAPVVFEYEVMSNMNTDTAAMQKIAELNLTDFTNSFIQKTNFTPERLSQVAEYGSVTDSIIEKSEGQVIDMIVMATQGAHNFLEKWLGTHAETVAKLSACPVWIIPENASLEYPSKILYAADFLENETQAIEKLLEIAKPFGASFKVVHVQEFFEPNIGHKIEHTIEELDQYFKNENISFKDIKRPSIIEGLEKYIEGYNPHVVAFGMHEKSIIAKIFNTSISRHFLKTANLPMLTFRN